MDLQLHNSQHIDKSIPVPLYYQIVDILREIIKDINVSGKEDDEISLPTEKELSEFFEVHRGTLRHALDILVREGLIYRERGRGTFLRRRRVQQDISTLISTTEDLKRRGWNPSTNVLGISKVIPRVHTRRVLNLLEGKKVWNLLRLRLANGEPIGVQRAFIPIDLMPNLDQHDLTNSLNLIMDQNYGLKLMCAEQTIRARRATTGEAELLEIKEGDPLIVITGVSWDNYDRPIEDMDSYWRYDRYDLHVRHTSE